jgi:D-glycero-D-manno-heptose 1,7-bisphosphate phosphatase
MSIYANKALFLDRDGVINKEKNYLYQIKEFEFIDGVFEACKYFQSQGYLIVIITNQAGIARGVYTKNDFEDLTRWMVKEFEKESVLISKVYHCSHHPEFSGNCECRKPKPKMIFDAQKEFDIDLTKSILVGDKNSDIEAGLNAGIKMNFLIQTGHNIKKNKFNVKILNNLIELKDKWKV